MTNIYPVLSARPLPSETDMIKKWGGKIKPKVSVCCSTFNHFYYIEDAIRSFLAQETTFPFEIIIRDDASTDGTTEVIKDYVKRYPSIIRVIVNDTNQFAFERAIHVWPKVARGDYIALCEGDDFWIDPHKLERQVSLMENYPGASMCVALCYHCRQTENGLVIEETTPFLGSEILGFEEIDQAYYHTSTYLVPKALFKEVVERYFAGHCLFGDTALREILITMGPFVLLPKVVSVYRITGAGIWSGRDESSKLEWNTLMTKKLIRCLPWPYKIRQYRKLAYFTNERMKNNLKNGFFLRALMLYPQFIWYKVLGAL
ncbi:MAG: glycosyltransferase [Gammaproteobacteria bacterium]|nr:MAG: glycosyltransferase [Gammaproteobacteria bacterium]